jgi:hypothetical protein
MIHLHNNFQISRLYFRSVVAAILLCIYYLWIPLFIFEEVQHVDFYSDFILTTKHMWLQLLASFVVIYIVSRAAAELVRFRYQQLQRIEINHLNKKISDFTVIIMCISSIPLIFGVTQVGEGRENLYEFIVSARQNIFLSVIFSIALVSSTLEIYFGRYKNIAFLLIFGILPELLFGTRVSVFRFVFLLLIILPWRPRFILPSVTLLGIIGMSRAIFTGYSSNSLYDYIILFLGDPINIALGTSDLLRGNEVICGIDGLHLFRSFIPPFGLRGFVDDYMGDVTVCINSQGFGMNGVYGLGGTPADDFIVTPISSFICFVFFILFIKYIKNLRINPLVKIYTPLLVISCAPYVMRNGLIATINHVFTVVFWILIPIFMLINWLRKQRKLTANKSKTLESQF